MLNSYICALDIGSSKISSCVAKLKGRSISSIFFETSPVRGIRDGAIVDCLEVVSCVGDVLRKLRVKSGLNIKYIYTNISGQDIFAKHSRSIIPLAERGNKVITLLDIEKCNEQARILGSSLDDEIIHAIPCGYSIDSKGNIANPLGLYSHRLEVDLYLICGKLSSVETLNRAINQAGYEIIDLFFSGLASSKIVFDNNIDKGINVFCDMGAHTTELLIFHDGTLSDIAILPIGGQDLTLQIQDALKIPFDLAEDIKRSYGLIGDSIQLKEDKEILVKKSNDYKPISQRLLLEVLNSKAKLICSEIKEVLEKKASLHTVNKFIVAGRTILLEGFIETLENTLGVPVSLARIRHPELSRLLKENSELSGQRYLNYITCLGIISEALDAKRRKNIFYAQSSKNILGRIINRAKELYHEYF